MERGRGRKWIGGKGKGGNEGKGKSQDMDRKGRKGRRVPFLP